MPKISCCSALLAAALAGCYGADPEDDRTELETTAAGITATQRCATRTPTASELAAQQPNILSATSAGLTVPVYVHVIRRGLSRADGNVSQSEVDAQIAALQASLFPDADPNAIRLMLAPDGTDFTTNSRWFTMTPGSSAEAEATAALHRGGAGALNLFIVGPAQGRLGWASFPWDTPGLLNDDVMMISHTTLPGGSNATYNQGDVAVHEFGHWMGLVHTFQGGCARDAAGGGDFVVDTPSERSPAYTCDAGRDTCGAIAGQDPIQNFMDYTDDACMTSFTAGQMDRMRRAYAFWRAPR